MTWSITRYSCVLAVMVLLFSSSAPAADLTSRYTTITYFSDDDLRAFNRELYMGRLQSRLPKNRGNTVADEVIVKIDYIVEKVMSVLDMYPADLRFSIVIHPDTAGVKQEFKRLYHMDVNYIAFYSPTQNQVFFSANNARLRVVAHEIGHVVAENYFTISPPQKIHEVMAQFAEQHITD